MHRDRGRMAAVVVAASLCFAATAPWAASGAAPKATGSWSHVAGKAKSLHFAVTFAVKTVGFNIQLPGSRKAASVTAPRGFQCRVDLLLVLDCHGTLAANHSAAGTVVLEAAAPAHNLGGHLHGFTGAVGVDGTMTGP